ncbi:MAG: hypothetical protein D6782_05630 [Alphaproteobacteria bacterium]|nr:MAG: hypothetical protein D6782_05630 [Alphaproteobacteria bacterium]
MMPRPALARTHERSKNLQRQWTLGPDMVFFAASDVHYDVIRPSRRADALADARAAPYRANGEATVGTRLQLGERLELAGSVTSKTERQRSDAGMAARDRVDASVRAAYRSPLGLLSFGYDPAALATSTGASEADRLRVRLARPGWMPGPWQVNDRLSWLRVDPVGLDGGFREISMARHLQTILKSRPHGAAWTLAIEPMLRARQYAPSPDPKHDQRRDITASLATTWRHAIAAGVAFTARLNMERRYSSIDDAEQTLADMRLRLQARF